jgi:hypothetical protein
MDVLPVRLLLQTRVLLLLRVRLLLRTAILTALLPRHPTMTTPLQQPLSKVGLRQHLQLWNYLRLQMVQA